MLTFWVSRPDSLLGTMALALLMECAPPESTVGAAQGDFDDFGGLRIELHETGRWICLFNESVPHHGVSAALAAGAASVLNMNSTPSDFRRALDAMLRSETTYVPLNLLKWVAGQAVAGRRATIQTTAGDSTVRLTEREREVLGFVAQGFSNAEIATALTISPNTVRTHLHALATKLGAPSRARMLAKARSLGISEASDDERADESPITVSA